MISKKVTIISIFFIFLVAPLLGYIFSISFNKTQDSAVLSPPERSKEDIQNAITTENSQRSDSDRIDSPRVTSIQRLHTVWYVAYVSVSSTRNITNYGHEDNKLIALVGDFRNDKEKLSVVLMPGDLFPYTNISNELGVPYDVVDKINAFYNHDHDEEFDE